MHLADIHKGTIVAHGIHLVFDGEKNLAHDFPGHGCVATKVDRDPCMAFTVNKRLPCGGTEL